MVSRGVAIAEQDRATLQRVYLLCGASAEPIPWLVVAATVATRGRWAYCAVPKKKKKSPFEWFHVGFCSAPWHKLLLKVRRALAECHKRRMWCRILA
ncbi:hypothetical protein E2C01_090057 [Portunus trituberculatus]|uniref:Uncharacterized protein n=1 Tax=Portunus trituberculatus TaxID=210409 RepID=A0A5B7JJ88_PORTR|nr:hypothetical protein [Portunus trituberculatus]